MQLLGFPQLGHFLVHRVAIIYLTLQFSRLLQVKGEYKGYENYPTEPEQKLDDGRIHEVVSRYPPLAAKQRHGRHCGRLDNVELT